MKSYADRHDTTKRRRRNSALDLFREEMGLLNDEDLQGMVDGPTDYVNETFNQLEIENADGSQSVHLICEDELAEAEGLVGKSEFLEVLEQSVRAKLRESFEGTGFTEKDCPWLKHLFRHYGRRSAKYLEHSIHKYLPSSRQAESIEGYIIPLQEKVERAIAAWLKTGQITEVPAEIPRSLMRVAGQDAANQRARMGKGIELDSSTKSKMEGAFGANVGDVKVHTESEGSAFAEELDAQAATIGKDIAFGAGKYKPGTPEGDALIAHELAHVMQQQGSAETGEMGSGADYSAMEEDAEGATRGVLGRLWGGMKSSFSNLKANAWPRLKSGLQVQRCAKNDVEHIAEPLTEPEIDTKLEQERKEVQSDDSKWDYWTVDIPPSKKCEDLATKFKNGTEGRAKSDPTNGDPGNANRWVRVYWWEVRDAILYLNDWTMNDFNHPVYNKKIKVPTADFWNGLELRYYSDSDFILGGKYRRERLRMEPLIEEGEKLPQELTISEANAQGKTLPQKAIETTSGFDTSTVLTLDDPEMVSWIYLTLGPYRKQIEESATSNQIPKRLLVTVLIAELSDISVIDVNQTEGSIGMAQIQIETAFKDNLVDYPKEELDEQKTKIKTNQPTLSDDEVTELAKKEIIKNRLWIPQYAIEGAAREINLLLTQMGQNQDNPWQKRVNFTAASPTGETTYDHVSDFAEIAGIKKMEGQVARESNLAKTVTGAYNSPNLITASTDAEVDVQTNGVIHGDNASIIAFYMYMWNIFGR